MKNKEILGFTAYEGTTKLTTLGNLVDMLDPTDTILPLTGKKNADGSLKRLTLLIKDKDGDSTTVVCSQALSDGLRNKEITLAQAIGFPVVRNEAGTRFLSIPAPEMSVEGIAVGKIKVQPYEAKATGIAASMIDQLLAQA